MLETCLSRPTRAVCVREVQNSIKESVRQLLGDKIVKFGLGSHFEATETEIRGPNNSLIVFKGMQHYNAESIKSLEGYDIAWVEEAQSLSGKSLRLLRPTIRKEGSELWFSWNPRNDTDPVDLFLRGPNKPKNAKVVKVGWQDNPWFPDVLRAEKDADYATDPEMAEHVWGGAYEIISEGSYYAKYLLAADNEGRIGSFPYDPKHKVDTAWDIGVDDYTAVWLLQNDGVKAWACGYYETSGEGPETIIPAALPGDYQYGTHYFPHDIRNREWGAGARSRLETVRSLGLRNIHIGNPNNDDVRIAAVRRLLPKMAFDTAADLGVRRLRNYRRRRHEKLGIWLGVLHDENSHGADAFGEYAINAPINPVKPKVPPRNPADIGLWRTGGDETSWRVA